MKKNLFFIFCISVFFVILSPDLFAQAANNEQRIVGTWVDENDGKIWTFNANGTGTVDGINIKWGIAQNKIAMVINSETLVLDFTISSDGRILLMSLTMGRGYFLRKRT